MTAAVAVPVSRPARTSPSAALLRAVRVHGRALAWLLPVLAVGIAVQAIGMAGSPQRIDDEGTYTAQAWAVAKLGELAHYTYWYDHPPLGWLQLAAYGQLTFAFDRYDIAIIAMREAMVFFTAIATALLWLLARRVGLGRPAATVAALLFALSPLAVQFHRTVYLDNVAVPWLLAAFVLATVRRQQLVAFAGAALCFGVAVLSKETFLLALPFLAWMMIRSARPETRRYTLAVAGSVLVLVGGSYLVLAAVKGELVPGRGHVSLTDGILFQLGTRASSGSIADPGSLLRRTVAMWVQLDPVFLVAGVLAAVVALGIRAVRPLAAGAVVLVALLLRPSGYTPVPYVIVLLPLFALAIAAVGERAVRGLRTPGTRRAAGVLGATAALVAVVVAVPVWTSQLRGLLLADLDAPGRQAEHWLETNVPAGSRMIVDDTVWVDLVRAGFAQKDVVWYYKVDTDPAVTAEFPEGWRNADYVVTTDSMRTFALTGTTGQAIRNSAVVARFGSGSTLVEVRRVVPQGLAAARSESVAAGAVRSRTNAELLRNGAVVLPTAAREALLADRVDPRVAVALASLGRAGSVDVGALPEVAGETTPLRRALITAVGGRPLERTASGSTAITAAIRGAGDGYAPQQLTWTDRGLLVTWPVAATA